MPCYSIDRNLISIKLFYFLTLAGIATLLPYLPIFLTQLGIRASELAIIYSLIFFVTFFKNIVVGYLADKFQKHKAILILSSILTGPLYCVLVAVPQGTTDSSVILNLKSKVIFCVANEVKALDIVNSTYDCSFPNQYLTCASNFTQCITESPFLEEGCSIDCGGDTVQNSFGFFLLNDAVTSSETNYSVTSSQKLLKCQLNSSTCKSSPFTTRTFWLCLVIVLAAALCGSNELMLNDAILISKLGEDRSKWGKSRLWGSAGYAIGAIVVSLVIDRLAYGQPVAPVTIDYDPAFYVYLALSLLSAIVAAFHPTSSNAVKAAQEVKGLKSILWNIRMIWFLCLVLFLGILNGVFITYGYLYLRIKFHASQLCIGLCVLVTVIVEVPTLLVGGKIVEQVGTRICLYLAFVAYTARFLLFVYIPNEWWALAVESTHLFTFGLMFTAVMMHAGGIANKNTLGTVIGLVNGVLWGLGLGVGSLVGGAIAETYDYDTLFLVSGIGSLKLLGIFVVWYEVILRFCCLKEKEETKTADIKDGEAEGTDSEVTNHMIAQSHEVTSCTTPPISLTNENEALGALLPNSPENECDENYN